MPDRRRLAAAGARAGPADVADRMLAEHQVGERLLVAVGVWASAGANGRSACRASRPIERGLARGVLGDLVGHEQRVVARAPRTPRRIQRSPCSGRGSTKMPKAAGSRPCFARHLGVLLRVGRNAPWRRRRDRRRRARPRRTRRSASRDRSRATAMPRIALSGQALTQAMQPTHRSAMSCGSAARGG